MPSKNRELRSLSARLAAATRWERPDAPELRRELDAARLAVAVEKIDYRDLLRLLNALHGASADDPDIIDDVAVPR